MLDNPIWHALRTEQTRFAERARRAARFPPAVTALAAVEEPDAIGDLVTLIGPREVAGVLLDAPVAWPAGLGFVDAASVLQMIHDGPAPAQAEVFESLGPADAADMLALAETTRPGPFGLRTGELGRWIGVRDSGRLIAIAGQRMRLPGLVEVSGVCTDPAFAGRGHAARLVVAQLAIVYGGGAAGAFLHVRADNARAIALYERLGFRARRTFHYAIVRAA